MTDWTQYYVANRTASVNLREMTFSPHTKYKCTYYYSIMVGIRTALETPYEPPTSTMTAYLFFFDLNEQ